jgi:Domain of unknown function (DUF5011)
VAVAVIQVIGDNPAIIRVGDTYADLGATITGPTADLNLGIKTFLNGKLVSNIVLDTSSVATDTIDYVATDSQGVSATSTRTVLTETTASPPQRRRPTLPQRQAPNNPGTAATRYFGNSYPIAPSIPGPSHRRTRPGGVLPASAHRR